MNVKVHPGDNTLSFIGTGISDGFGAGITNVKVIK
jgi:hypothetical protein